MQDFDLGVIMTTGDSSKLEKKFSFWVPFSAEENITFSTFLKNYTNRD